LDDSIQLQYPKNPLRKLPLFSSPIRS